MFAVVIMACFWTLAVTPLLSSLAEGQGDLVQRLRSAASGFHISGRCVGKQPSSEMAKGEETVITAEISNEALCFMPWPSAESKMCL